MILLKDKVAFITGGASGIGLGTAVEFARNGASVAIADLPDSGHEAAMRQIESAGAKDRAAFFACDVSQPAQVQAAIDATAEWFGGLDIVFANAGINGVWAPIDEIKPEEWDKTQAINLKGTFLTVRYAVPHLKRRGGGSIIVCSSVNGNRTFSTAGATAYSVSKAGQVALARMAAIELGQHGIRVNVVCPGAIATNIDESTKKRHTDELGVKVEFPEGSPAVNEGRGCPVDVAQVCLFLASGLSSHVSGVEIYVDGGESLVR